MQLKKYIKKIINDEFVNASFFSGLSSIIKILTTLIIGKIVATLSGAEGFALFGQLLNFVLIITIVTGGCITQGVTKYVAEYNVTSTSKLSELISTSFKITCYTSIILGILMIIFAYNLSEYILYDAKYWLIFIIFGFTITFYSINGLLLAILNGFKKYKVFNTLNIILNVGSLILTLILTYLFNTYGVLLSIILNQSIILIITLIFLRNESWLIKDNFSLKINKKQLKLLLAFAGMGILTSAISPFTSIAIRDSIISNISLADAGIYEFIQRICGAVLIFFSITLSTYFLPRISEISDKILMFHEIKKTAIISLPLILFLLILIYFLRKYIIVWLGSKDFLYSESLFIYALIGVFCKVCAQILGFVFVAKAKIKAVIVIEVLYNVFFVIISIFLIRFNHLEGAMEAFMICNILYFLGVVFTFYNNFGIINTRAKL